MIGVGAGADALSPDLATSEIPTSPTSAAVIRPSITRQDGPRPAGLTGVSAGPCDAPPASAIPHAPGSSTLASEPPRVRQILPPQGIAPGRPAVDWSPEGEIVT